MPVHFRRRRTSFGRKLVRFFLILLLLPVLLAGAWLIWQSVRDPLAAMPVADLHRQRMENHDDFRVALAADDTARIRKTVDWTDDHNLPVRILIDAPVDLETDPERRRPVILLVSGLRKGRDNVESFPGTGDNIVIGFEYPLPRRITTENSLGLEETPRFYDQILSTPGQIADVLAWIEQQPWTDTERVSVVAASLGAFITPAALHLAGENASGVTPDGLAIGFGGADLSLLFKAVMEFEGLGSPISDGLGLLAGAALQPLEPALHLPALENMKILALSGEGDPVISAESVVLMESLLPPGRIVERLPVGHVGDEDDATRLALLRVFQWMEREKLINPLPSPAWRYLGKSGEPGRSFSGQ